VRDSGDRQALQALDEQCRQSREQYLQHVETLLNQHQFEQAAQETRKLMFLEKFGEEISRFADGPDSTN
ncbi:MAG: co-chaperone HscB, partial [Oxalobacter sp.]|nr:co-chaperone HscB [Oxalobacter sp.]